MQPADAWILLEGWEEKTRSDEASITPDHSLVPITRPGFAQAERAWHAYPNQDCRDGHRALGIWCNVDACFRDGAELTALACQSSDIFHTVLCRLTVLALRRTWGTLLIN